MNGLKENQKAEAMKRLNKLGVAEQSVKEFQDNGRVTLSEDADIFHYLNSEEQKMVDEFEQKHNALVYYVIKNNTSVGLIYSLLFVSQYHKEWGKDMADIEAGQALVYAVNKDIPDYSEFWSIGIQLLFGSLHRIW